MASKNKATLHYFNGKGKAEILRLVMAATGVEVINRIYLNIIILSSTCA